MLLTIHQELHSHPNPSTHPPSNRYCNIIWRKFILVILWFAFTGYMTGVTNAIADNRSIHLHRDSEGKTANSFIGDIGFDFAQIFHKQLHFHFHPLSDYICVYVSIGTILLLSILAITFKLKTLNEMIIIATNLIVLANILFTLRFLNITLTSFPTPNGQINEAECTTWSNIWTAPFLIISGQRTACHDFFFSGHTCVVTIIALYITKYTDVLENNGSNIGILIRIILIVGIWFVVFLTITFLLLEKLHYSIDITTASILTVVFWKLSQYEMKQGYGFFAWWNTQIYEYDQHDRIE